LLFPATVGTLFGVELDLSAILKKDDGLTSVLLVVPCRFTVAARPPPRVTLIIDAR